LVKEDNVVLIAENVLHLNIQQHQEKDQMFVKIDKRNAILKVTLLYSENIKNVQLNHMEKIKIERDVVLGK